MIAEETGDNNPATHGASCAAACRSAYTHVRLCVRAWGRACVCLHGRVVFGTLTFNAQFLQLFRALCVYVCVCVCVRVCVCVCACV